MGDIVLLSEDDAYAVATRRLVADYEGLNSVDDPESDAPLWLVSFSTTAQLHYRNDYSLTSVVTLYNVTMIIHGAGSAARKMLKNRRPEPPVIDRIVEESVSYWDALREHYSPDLSELRARP